MEGVFTRESTGSNLDSPDFAVHRPSSRVYFKVLVIIVVIVR